MGLLDLLWDDGPSPEGLSPLDKTLNATTVHNHTLAVAQRCGEELGEDEEVVVNSCPGDGGPLSHPEGPLSVGLDGGYVRDWGEKQRHFEVIVGKAIPTAEPAKCFGFVQSCNTKSQQRLQSVLQSQGGQDHQLLTFLSDGGETVRNLPGSLHPQSVHLLDWFHLVRQEVVGVTVRHGASRDWTWCSITSTLGGEARR